MSKKIRHHTKSCFHFGCVTRKGREATVNKISRLSGETVVLVRRKKLIARQLLGVHGRTKTAIRKQHKEYDKQLRSASAAKVTVMEIYT